MNPVTVVYDGHCRLCVGSVERMRRWPKAERLAFVPLQAPEAKALLPGKSDEELSGQMHVVEEGLVSAGAEGWFRLMRFAPLRLRWIAWVTPRFLARPIYAWIARNRYRWFGSACEDGSCAVHPRKLNASGDRRSSSPNDSPGPS